MDMAEYGHQKEKLSKKVKQINLCLVFGQKTFTPVYYVLYNGSLHDSKTLYFTVSKLNDIISNQKFLFVLDRSFFGNSNINSINKAGQEYLCAVPFTNSFVKDLVDKYREIIFNPLNAILTNTQGKLVFGIHEQIDLSTNNTGIHVHLFFNEDTYTQKRNKLYETIAIVKKLLIDGDDISDYEDFIKNYFRLTNIRGKIQEKSIKLNEKSINNHLKYSGWSAFVSNTIQDSQNAHDIYHNRDMVEKGFFKYKNVLNLKRIKVQSDRRANSKLFIVFLCLIIDRYIFSFTKNHKNLRRYSLDKLLRIMQTIKSSYNSKGKLIVGPLTKEQN
jgi:transposase